MTRMRRISIRWQLSLCILAYLTKSTIASTAPLAKGSYSYIGGKSKEISNHGSFISPSSPPVPTHQHQSSTNIMSSSAPASSLAATSYYEPRGDYGGGGGGWGHGGGGGGHSVYQYSLHPQSYYHPAPMYYDDGGYEGVEKGLVGLLGLGGLKGLLGLLGLAKLLLPLLGLLLPLLLPLLLLKALALLALILLIPVPVITTGGATVGRKYKIPTTFTEGKMYLKEAAAELLSKIPTDINQIIGKIKDSSQSTDISKDKDIGLAKQISDQSISRVAKNKTR